MTLKIQQFKRNAGAHLVCSGSYVYGLDLVKATDIASAVRRCNGRQALLIVGNGQRTCKNALRQLAKQRKPDSHGMVYNVKKLGKWSSTSQLVLVKGKYKGYAYA